MKPKLSFLIPCLGLAAVTINSCAQSPGQAALGAIDQREKAWEAKSPEASEVSAESLITDYREAAQHFPDIAEAANDRITHVVNWQTLARR